ncbi:hypothetical protein BDZ91DRAFT_850950 [Kalaharituber pfeilii]|nr:hypothetical protein BDZ91DRAFT_850950 [Kalaharituber pfeilii]
MRPIVPPRTPSKGRGRPATPARLRRSSGNWIPAVYTPTVVLNYERSRKGFVKRGAEKIKEEQGVEASDGTTVVASATNEHVDADPFYGPNSGLTTTASSPTLASTTTSGEPTLVNTPPSTPVERANSTGPAEMTHDPPPPCHGVPEPARPPTPWNPHYQLIIWRTFKPEGETDNNSSTATTPKKISGPISEAYARTLCRVGGTAAANTDPSDAHAQSLADIPTEVVSGRTLNAVWLPLTHQANGAPFPASYQLVADAQFAEIVAEVVGYQQQGYGRWALEGVFRRVVAPLPGSPDTREYLEALIVLSCLGKAQRGMEMLPTYDRDGRLVTYREPAHEGEEDEEREEGNRPSPSTPKTGSGATAARSGSGWPEGFVAHQPNPVASPSRSILRVPASFAPHTEGRRSQSGDDNGLPAIQLPAHGGLALRSTAGPSQARSEPDPPPRLNLSAAAAPVLRPAKPRPLPPPHSPVKKGYSDRMRQEEYLKHLAAPRQRDQSDKGGSPNGAKHKGQQKTRTVRDSRQSSRAEQELRANEGHDQRAAGESGAATSIRKTRGGNASPATPVESLTPCLPRTTPQGTESASNSGTLTIRHVGPSTPVTYTPKGTAKPVSSPQTPAHHHMPLKIARSRTMLNALLEDQVTAETVPSHARSRGRFDLPTTASEARQAARALAETDKSKPVSGSILGRKIAVPRGMRVENMVLEPGQSRSGVVRTPTQHD